MSTPSPTHPAAANPWAALLDDAATFPPGDLPLAEAITAHREHHAAWYAHLVGPFVVTDTDLPQVGEQAGPLALIVTGGAGAISGPLEYCRRKGAPVAAVEIALRDLDDLPGNARRVIAALDEARDAGLLDDDTPAYLEIPATTTPGGLTTYGWLGAADAVAERELRLKFRTGGLEEHDVPTAGALASWIDAALERETAFKCTAGLHRAVAHADAEHHPQHGFLNVLLATRASFDGAGTEEVAALLAEHDAGALAARARDLGNDTLARTRRWFTSFGTCSITEPVDDLVVLDLIDRAGNPETTGGDR